MLSCSSERVTSEEEEEEVPVPSLPARQCSTTELGLEDAPPPLPPRNFNWSDVEDNDEEVRTSVVVCVHPFLPLWAVTDWSVLSERVLWS